MDSWNKLITYTHDVQINHTKLLLTIGVSQEMNVYEWQVITNHCSLRVLLSMALAWLSRILEE